MTATEREEPFPLPARTRNLFRFNTNVLTAQSVDDWITAQDSHRGFARVAMSSYSFCSALLNNHEG
jgi:hypothetical protein